MLNLHCLACRSRYSVSWNPILEAGAIPGSAAFNFSLHSTELKGCLIRLAKPILALKFDGMRLDCNTESQSLMLVFKGHSYIGWFFIAKFTL